ncbi:siderophore-interacting protein [Flaviflexus huanghaiensis]|uniref:siderophore-interacting protein n=1 Tax=Flaviflexus huanghaiensis TaxID=1111473 RepID=UPI0015FE0240|nr:siderophore-interacting protein [Flaviflexus huanghaiensis]
MTRPNRPTTHLEVLGRTWLTPHMLRLVVGGPNFGAFVNAGHADSYIKLVFDPAGRPYPTPVDVAHIRATAPREHWPMTRTYTVRSVDHESISIDFVIHGETGIAAPWARSAAPGDLVQFMGPGGAWSPKPEADYHLFVGDESAFPAIAAGVERLPNDARGAAIIEVDSHPLPLAAPAGMAIEWLVRRHSGDDATLAGRVQALDLPPGGDISVFAHGEREAVKRLRRVFSDLEVPRDRLSISGYWARGRDEDVFQAEKRTDVGRI